MDADCWYLSKLNSQWTIISQSPDGDRGIPWIRSLVIRTKPISARQQAEVISVPQLATANINISIVKIKK